MLDTGADAEESFQAAKHVRIVEPASPLRTTKITHPVVKTIGSEILNPSCVTLIFDDSLM